MLHGALGEGSLRAPVLEKLAPGFSIGPSTMFTSSQAVFECKEPVTSLVQRWHLLIVPRDASGRLYSGAPNYRGVISEHGFDLTLYPGRHGFPVVCRGEFQPLANGTQVFVQFLPAITLGRMMWLAGACIALAISAFVTWMFWEIGVPVDQPTSIAFGVGALTLMCVLGAGIAYFMMVYWMGVRFARNHFQRNITDPGRPS